MDKSNGKRVQQSSKNPRGSKALVVIIIVVVALAAAYVGLCVRVDRSGTYLPNTTIAGEDVSGLTQVEAATRLNARLEQAISEKAVEFTCGGNTYSVPLSDFNMDIGGTTQQVMTAQGGNLFTGGARYLASLFGGSDYPMDVALAQTPAAVTQAIEECADPESQTTWTIGETEIVFEKGRTGRTLDIAYLQAALSDRAAHLLANDEPAGYAPIEAEVITAPPAVPDFEAIHQELFAEPADAYLDAETKEIVPSVTGVSFDIPAARAALEDTPEGGQCIVPLILEEPEMTTELLSTNLFADVLGTSTTKCSGPANRWDNIDLACSRVNGTILLPGEEFSYNALCGPYTVDGGYKKAGAYVGGKNVDTTAGGICQLTSTLYWSVLKANLEVVERNQHKYNSGYMPVVGTDATVYSDTLDFRFKNNTEYPIKIECYQDSSHRLHVTLYGTDTTGIHGEPYSVVLATVPYKTIYVADATKVPVGGEPVRDEDWARYNGITVEVYQKLVDKDGKTVDTIYLYKNTYSVSNPRYWYNPADAERLGIDPATGEMTKTPVTPSPTPSTSPTPSIQPTPSTQPTPSVEPTPSAEPTPPVETSAPPVIETPTPSAEPPVQTIPVTDVPQTPAA